ncbi:MAG: hypothetical protein IT337_16765 [Thermomicrobiales bacterium]|nr:hypothetical protein [Thermomicrobiales bacterium]
MDETLPYRFPAVGASARHAAPVFVWKSFSRFVEVYPVETGWLVLWGRYEDRGARRVLSGQRVYAGLVGARARLRQAVLDLTSDAALAGEALVLFDRHRFPAHRPRPLPPPL